MDNTAIYMAGPILSAISMYFMYRRKNVKKWMNERRIDEKSNEQMIFKLIVLVVILNFFVWGAIWEKSKSRKVGFKGNLENIWSPFSKT